MLKTVEARIWSEDELDRIKDLIHQGVNRKEIANMFRTSSSSIHRLNNKYQWVSIKKKPRLNFLREDIEDIRGLVEDGYSFEKISNLLNFSMESIRRLNEKYKWRNYDDNLLEKYKRIASLYLLPPDGKGMSQKEISEKEKIHSSLIFRSLKRLGLSDKFRCGSELWTPKRKETQSKIRLKWWEEQGGLGFFLKNHYTNRDDAVNYLNGLVIRMKNLGNDAKAFNTYQKYMEIINNHTFPDEVHQPQSV